MEKIKIVIIGAEDTDKTEKKEENIESDGEEENKTA